MVTTLGLPAGPTAGAEPAAPAMAAAARRARAMVAEGPRGTTGGPGGVRRPLLPGGPRVHDRAAHDLNTDPICLNPLGSLILLLAAGKRAEAGRSDDGACGSDHRTSGPRRCGTGRRGRLRPGDGLRAGPAVRRQGREPVLAPEELPGPEDADRAARPGGAGRPCRRSAGRPVREGRPRRLRPRLPGLRPRPPRPLRGGPPPLDSATAAGSCRRPDRAADPGRPARLRPDRAGPDPRGPPPRQRLPRLRQPGNGRRLQPQRARLRGVVGPDPGRPRLPAAHLARPPPETPGNPGRHDAHHPPSPPA